MRLLLKLVNFGRSLFLPVFLMKWSSWINVTIWKVVHVILQSVDEVCEGNIYRVIANLFSFRHSKYHWIGSMMGTSSTLINLMSLLIILLKVSFMLPNQRSFMFMSCTFRSTFCDSQQQSSENLREFLPGLIPVILLLIGRNSFTSLDRSHVAYFVALYCKLACRFCCQTWFMLMMTNPLWKLG